jgi:Fuc2NAc and GlcNAc transferase
MSVELLFGLISAAISLTLTPVVRSYALRHKVLDEPNDRSSHTVPTPRGGGLAILIAVIVTTSAAVVIGVGDARVALALGSGMLALGVIGWIDDTRGLPARFRLAAHFAIALWAMYVLGGMPALRLGNFSLAVGTAGYLLGALGIVWSINLFNFMDGIDGLAGSQATLIFGAAAGLLFWAGDRSLVVLAAIIGGASAGFLVWNWPPAKIFMGDVGSGSLGYGLAVLALASEKRGSVPLLAFAILAGVFISDATVTLIRRLRRGRRLAEAHRDHAYQRLARAWGGHRPVSIAAAIVTGVLAFIGTVAVLTPRFLLIGLLISSVLLGLLLAAAERKVPM